MEVDCLGTQVGTTTTGMGPLHSTNPIRSLTKFSPVHWFKTGCPVDQPPNTFCKTEGNKGRHLSKHVFTPSVSTSLVVSRCFTTRIFNFGYVTLTVSPSSLSRTTVVT